MPETPATMKSVEYIQDLLDELVSRNGMSFTAIKALTWGDGALTCKAVIITRH